jgi:hypothetical protein
MTPPVKDNVHIRSDKQAFIESYLRARTELGKLEGVVGVGFGRKETADEFTSNVAIQVYVREKKPNDALPPEQRVPPTFEGYRTDVRIVPRMVSAACDNQTRYPTIQGGIQIQSRDRDSTFTGDYGKGTLGCIVRKRSNTSSDNLYLLTCEHVLYTDESGEDGYVFHPSTPASGNTTSAHLLGTITTEVKRDEVLHRDGIHDCFIDCGIVKIDLGSTCFGTQCTGERVQWDTTIVDLHPPGAMVSTALRNRITDVRDAIMDVDLALPDGATPTDANRVYKVGRTTGRTVGIVMSVNASVEDHINLVGTVFRHGVMEVAFDESSELLGANCKNNQAFIENGDSGSLVVDKDHRAVGLAFGSRMHPVPEGSRKYPGYVCNIVPVLDELDICIPTTGGTSHGSSEATDGSGLALYAPGSRLPAIEGDVLFTAAGVSDPPRRRAADPDLVPDLKRERLGQLLAAFGETPHGRVLHAAITEALREVGFLIRQCRPVKVVWHRHKGPAFLAYALKHLRGESDRIPRDIGGVSRTTLIASLRDVLVANGSALLVDSIAEHGDELARFLEAETVDEWLAMLRNAAPAGELS